MADLLELRDRIDEIDHEIARLYEARMGVCREVGEYKIANGSKVFDRQREKEKISAVKTMVHGEFNKKGIGELFEQPKVTVSAADGERSSWKASVY